LSVFVAVLGFSLVAPIFPTYAQELGASYTFLGIIVSVYGGVQLLSQVPIGRFSDRTGRKTILVMGLITFTIMPILYIYATNAYTLIGIRVLGGIGASAVWPMAMAMIVDQVGIESRGSAMGWYNAAFYSAVALGPLIGGGLYDLMGLKAPFYFWAALGLVSAIIVAARVKEPERRQPLPIEPHERPSENMILAGYTLTFLACCGIVTTVGMVGGFNFTLLPSFGSRLGLSTVDIGFIYLDYAGAMTISNIYFGRVADRGRRKLLITGGSLAGAASLALLLFASNLLEVALLYAILGIGLGMGSPAAASLVADATCISRRGEIFGIFNTARMLGIVVGPLIAGSMADVYGVYGAIAAFTLLSGTIAISTLGIKDPLTRPTCTENDMNP
jgi:MFS transporter, DHA1 family, multidrug resistance protein